MKEIKANMTGTIIGVLVKVGDSVAIDQDVISIESMKMEKTLNRELDVCRYWCLFAPFPMLANPVIERVFYKFEQNNRDDIEQDKLHNRTMPSTEIR